MELQEAKRCASDTVLLSPVVDIKLNNEIYNEIYEINDCVLLLDAVLVYVAIKPEYYIES